MHSCEIFGDQHDTEDCTPMWYDSEHRDADLPPDYCNCESM